MARRRILAEVLQGTQTIGILNLLANGFVYFIGSRGLGLTVRKTIRLPDRDKVHLERISTSA